MQTKSRKGQGTQGITFPLNSLSHENEMKQLRYFLPTVLTFLVWLLTPQSVTAQLIDRHEFHPVPDGIQGEEEWAKTIQISKDISSVAKVSVTAKGNGVLSVANLRLRVFDAHDDGIIYEDGLLRTEFIDIDRDGCKDLVISGIALSTGEKEGEPAMHHCIVFIYMFDPKQKKFVCMYKTSGFDIQDMAKVP